MSHDLYITGTDTDVGKTYVSTRIISRLIEQGERVGVMKPVASGSEYVQGELRNADAIALMGASNVRCAYGDVNPFAYEPAIAPEFAADQAQRPVELGVVGDAFARIKAQSDRVIVEGAGGWLSPVNAQTDQSDMARALHINDVILVVGMKLGCQHNARATALAIERHGLTFFGWIANEAAGTDSEFDENVRVIRRYMEAPLLATIRHNGEPTWLQDIQ